MCVPPRSSSYDKFLVQKNSHFAAEHIEQNNDAIAITHALDQAQTISKDAVVDADFVVKRKLRSAIQLNEALWILADFQIFDDRLVQSSRDVAVAHKAHNTDGRMN